MSYVAHPRAGVTLVELTVTVSLLALVATLAGVAIARQEPSGEPSIQAQVRSARRDAIRTGQPVRLVVRSGTATYRISAMPDGSVVADTALRFDRATGEVNHAAQAAHTAP